MEHLIEQYRQGYSKLLQEVEGMTEEQLTFKPSEKSWSIREIIIHVSDAELVHIHRLKSILSEDNPNLTAFDQDLWTTRLGAQQLDHQLYLQVFKALRESFLPILLSLKEEDYSRIGTHNEAGPQSFNEVLEHAIDHVDNHIGQIKRVKQQFKN